MNERVALITGAARRIGAAIAEHLHAQGWRVIIHYRQSEKEAQQLLARLLSQRSNSAALLQGDLSVIDTAQQLGSRAHHVFGRLDALINNASSFYPTPIDTGTYEQFRELLSSNLEAPLLLSQSAAPFLALHQGSIINITDIHAAKPLKGHTFYCVAKAGLNMLTLCLAQELGPNVRVNAVAPGAIMWPEGENEMDPGVQEMIIERTALKRSGQALDIALAVESLLNQPFVTGQILAVDGGRR